MYANLQEELVSGDLFQEPARVGGVELDTEVQRHRRGRSQLGADALGRVQPVLEQTDDSFNPKSFRDKDTSSYSLVGAVLESQTEVRGLCQVQVPKDGV